jgi:hypothetical protein
VVGFKVVFFAVVICVFCRGFQEKWTFERGFFVVRLWWLRGECGVFGSRFLAAKNTPLFLTLFLRRLILGRICTTGQSD